MIRRGILPESESADFTALWHADLQREGLHLVETRRRQPHRAPLRPTRRPLRERMQMAFTLLWGGGRRPWPDPVQPFSSM